MGLDQMGLDQMEKHQMGKHQFFYSTIYQRTYLELQVQEKETSPIPQPDRAPRM